MSNHYHLVLHVNSEQSKAWTNDEVIVRWQRLYRGSILVQRFKRGEKLGEAGLQKVNEVIGIWRERLSNISWFMALLNQHIAREANKEDGCTGRFWEGRFKSQALLDESALLSCMAYVDLNPVRAAIADDLERSDFTSIQKRLEQIQREKESEKTLPEKQEKLMPFIESEHKHKTFAALPFNLKDYIELVDWTGRIIRNDKRGAISQNQPKALARIGLTEDQWLTLSIEIQKQSVSMLSGIDQLVRLEQRLRQIA